ncbi:hypothetical protein [Acinetobacter guillouiae]|uniref:hypothetical protein n=1 Tax=Acinetobacter guillouiae TaxID=106649 RepID=UPI001FDA6B1D|nr:hypothetical protein [Acinetobacter guillouiae]MBP2544671.1 hypothetical protein [Acinetobacter guillouiae]
MENNSDTSNANGEKILYEFDEVYDLLNRYITTLIYDVKADVDPLDRSIKEILRSLLNGKIIPFREFIKENFETFENNELFSILINHIRTFRASIITPGNRTEPEHQKNVLDSTKQFIEKFETIKLTIISLQNANQLIKHQLQPALDEVKEKVKDFESVRLALEQRETNKIYIDLYKKYNNEYIANNIYFFGTIILAIIITLFTTTEIINFPQFSDYKTSRNFWIMFITTKVLIATVVLTFCTLFLRRSAHAKKLKEQAYQTHVEINAFPIHVRSLDKADKDELIKELALKYFGKELDQTQNDKIGDLMSDQIASGIELIKASAELVKAKSGSTPPQ